MNFKEAQGLAPQNISDIRFVAWDTETTGLDPRAGFIVEIAGIAFDEEFELRQFHSFIKPGMPIPREVSKIHGITDAMVVDSPGEEKVLPQFLEFLNWVGSPRCLLAHNAEFDIGFVRESSKRIRALGLAPEVVSDTAPGVASEVVPEVVIDTCILAKRLLPQLPSHSLAALIQHFQLPSLHAHRALDDVKRLQAVFLKLLGIAADSVVERNSIFTFEKLIDLAGGYFEMKLNARKEIEASFKLPPRIAMLHSLCGENVKVEILYGPEEECRYITPVKIRVKKSQVYVDAFCHKDDIQKTFRADKILRILTSR